MSQYGPGPSGFTMPTLADLVSAMQTQIWSSTDDTLDLSASSPDGKMLLIVAGQLLEAWGNLQIAYNQFNREDVEGAGLDNLGDIVGIPREGESFQQIYAVCTLDSTKAPFPGIDPSTPGSTGALVVSPTGLPSQVYTNLSTVTAADITAASGTPLVLFQSATAGPVPNVAPGVLTSIVSPVTGFSAVTNPEGPSQLGTAEELDTAYLARQSEELASEGSCTPAATAAAIVELGAAQQPPIDLVAIIVENTTPYQQTFNGVVLPPHSFEVFIYETDANGWATSSAGQAAIAALLWANKPAGIAQLGSTSYTLNDPVLGDVVVQWSVPTSYPLFVSAVLVPSPKYSGTFAGLVEAVQTALVLAAIARTPASGNPPVGQLAPGATVVGSQLSGVIMSVPGVFDVQSLTFDFHGAPSNTAPLPIPGGVLGVATIAETTASTNLQFTQGTYP